MIQMDGPAAVRNGVGTRGGLRLRCALTCGLVLAGLAGSASGLELEPALEAGVFSQYVWRGQVLNDRAVFQPAVSLGTDLGLAAEVWANLDLTDRNGRRGEVNEVNVTLSYALPFSGPIGIEIGYTEGRYPGSDEDAWREAWIALDADLFLSPGITAYLDLREDAVAYAEVRAGHSLEIAEGVSLGLGVSAGFATREYNDLYFGVDSAGINDVNATADLDLALSDSFTVTISGQFTYLPDSDLRAAASGIYADDQAVLVGVTLRYAF